MLNKPDKPADKPEAKLEPVVIKKYANRRLYNTETSTYVTLDDLAAMVRSERDFLVFDAKSGDDLTHSVLTQIIVDQESKAGTQTLLPVPFLRQLIRFYGDTMERMVPSYLQVSLDTLTREQDRFRKQFTTAFTPQGAFEAYQEQARKNLVMFEQAMTMFTPFGTVKAAGAAAARKPDGDASATAGEPSSTPPAGTTSAGKAAAAPKSGSDVATAGAANPINSDLAELKAELAAMQAKIEKLSKG